MTTALSIIQQAFYDLAITPPASIISATNTQQLSLKHLLYSEARYLRSLANWVQQKKTYSFTLTASRSKYPLPPDFQAPISDTDWDDDYSWPLIGPEGDSEFTGRLYGITGQSPQIAYRPFGPDGAISSSTSGGQFQIYPTPSSSGKTLVFEYYSRNLFIPAYWASGETGITLGKYRFSNGNIYKCTTAGTGTCSTTPPSGTTTFSEAGGGPTWTYQTGPYETIIADDDQCLFDDDVLIAGFKWRYLANQKMDYSAAAEEYKLIKSTAMTRFKGSFRGVIGGGNKGPRYQVPPGGWSF